MNPDADMTMLNALDITVNHKAVDHQVPTHLPESDTIAIHNETDLAKQLKDRAFIIEASDIEKSTPDHQDAADNIDEEEMWVKASGMMGDLDFLGSQLRTEVEASLKAIKHKEDSMTATVNSLSQRLENSQTEVTAIKLELMAVKAAAEEEREEMAAGHRTREEELQTQIDMHCQTVVSLEHKVKNLETKVEEMTDEALTRGKDKEVDEGEFSKLKTDFSLLSKELEAKIAVIKTLEEEAAASKKEEANLKKRIEGLDDEKAALSASLLSKDSDLSDLHEKLQAAEDHHMIQIADLEKQLDQVQDGLRKETADKEHFQQELTGLLELHEGLTVKYKEAKKTIKSQEEAIEGLKKSAGVAISQIQLRYYQELEKKYVQAKK